MNATNAKNVGMKFSGLLLHQVISRFEVLRPGQCLAAKQLKTDTFECTMVTADGEGFRMNPDHSHELRKQARSRELVAAYQMICKHKTFCNGAIWCHHGLKIG